MTMGRLLITSLVLVAALVAASSGNDSEENPEVRAPIGRIKGSLMTTRLGRNVYAFRGVRYAEPPTGQQRFQVMLIIILFFFADFTVKLVFFFSCVCLLIMSQMRCWTVRVWYTILLILSHSIITYNVCAVRRQSRVYITECYLITGLKHWCVIIITAGKSFFLPFCVLTRMNSS